ncbi:MAG: FecR domain-containing protein [Sulfurospirillaceae bacterium]|nr:FecR domain-containing protein [Sulfurospirillaceae bacterium]
MSSIIRILAILAFLWSSSLLASVGKVSLLKGEAFAQRGAQAISLKSGMSIEEKDTIKTLKNGQLQLIFEDKTVITLGSESEFKIEEYLNDNASPKAKFKFNQGTFKSITGRIGKASPENFTLETKTATIGIRGTTVGLFLPPPPPSPNMPPLPENIFCLSGQISVGALGSPNPPVTVPAGSWTRMLPPAGPGELPPPPTPPAPFTPHDLDQLNQGLGGGGPTPPPAGGTGEQQPSGNTPPTSNPPANDTPPTGGTGTPTPQNFTPTAASQAQQTNLQNSTQGAVLQGVADDLGIPSDDLQNQLENQTCPSGTSGTYPNCIAQACPVNTIGVYPNCVALTCPAGTTGTYPDCGTCTALQSGTYPNCVALTCPTGTTGTYPNCVALTCPTGTTGTYPNCVALTCPTGTTGTYPNCTAIPTGGGGGGGNSTPTVSLELSGVATSSYIESGVMAYDYQNPLGVLVANNSAVGLITLPGDNPVSFDSTSVSATSSTLFTVSISDSNISQLSSVSSPVSNVLWGKWTSTSDDNTTLLPTSENFWVAGKVADVATAASHIATIYNDLYTDTTYTYLGKSMGAVYNAGGQSFAIDPINDATNEVKLVFTFGNNAAPIKWPDSHIRFTANGYWDITTYLGSANALADGTFLAMLSGTGSIGGNMSGSFYGANAGSLGGTFTANNSDTSSSAIGAFVASKVAAETRTYLTGLATSTYIFNSDPTYSTTDDVEFELVNSNAVEGTINLYRDTPNLSTDGVAISLSSFGSSSSDLYWVNGHQQRWTTIARL